MSKRADQERFNELLESHRGILFKVANTYCRHPQDREDLAQEVTFQLWKAFPSYDDRRPFPTWMYRIALNVAISHARRGRNETLPLDAILDQREQSKEQDPRLNTLYAFIDKLDDLNRALLLLYMEERSYQEIAEILGISETNVATKISRLKQRIRQEAEDLR
jgi:RNA polymerase sigma factor (sigma-70 family)